MLDFIYNKQKFTIKRIKKLKFTPWMMLFTYESAGYTIHLNDLTENIIEELRKWADANIK